MAKLTRVIKDSTNERYFKGCSSFAKKPTLSTVFWAPNKDSAATFSTSEHDTKRISSTLGLLNELYEGSKFIIETYVTTTRLIQSIPGDHESFKL